MYSVSSNGVSSNSPLFKLTQAFLPDASNASYGAHLGESLSDSVSSGLFSDFFKPSQSNSVSITSSNLIFIDKGVKDYESLGSAVLPNAEIIFLDSSLDGISQISNVLAGRSNITSLSIISHGSSGGIQLGKTFYTLQSLSDRNSELQGWSTALTSDADILLYGCDIAAGATGETFIQTLGDLTGADIAASSDLTGSAALGGDWDLEVQFGSIETGLIFNNEFLQQYSGILPFISDLTWTSATNGWGPTERDRSNGEDGAGDGGVLRLN